MTTIANKVGYIYKIVCNNPEITDCYVGSCQSFRTRKTNHKNRCNNENNKDYTMNVYQFIRANGGWANFNMLAIEQVNYTIKHELLMRERFHLERLKATLNKIIPTRTQQEYYEANKTIINQQQKEHYEANKEKISERHKQYREDNKEQLIQYRRLNRDKAIKKSKEYYEANKNEILEQKKKQLITCECGRTVKKSDISKHRKTNIHIANLP